MNDIVSPVQSISYTNKDFVSVYEELLDLTKELTSQWDPSISNESDPGVILLKLNAVIADKCNYSIDKNILECFPLSVTQESNARQLFEQLGYYMHWYKAAETDVFIKWIGESSSNKINVPKFTMVTDTNENIIYTLLGPSATSITGQYNISDQTLYCDSSDGIVFKALQGLAVDYDINGDTLITVSNLDNYNRLYFPTTDIAENGIFIKNASEENYLSWQRKDNLLIENLGNTYYKFGVTKDGSSCYIEFPEDVETIFKDGINITYIRTNGILGNVSAQYISKFYNFNTVMLENEVITLDDSNVLVSNYSASVDGLNTEDINSAYRGYKRTVGTFDTLVTLRDYINYINNSGLVSNSFVCDRNNDIQLTYKIMTSINDVDQTITKIETDQGMNAYSLKLYLLTYVENVDLSNYNTTFSMITNNDTSTVKNYINDSQTINHEFLNTVDPSTSNPHICFFKNKCPIECTIITQSNLTDTQTNEMKANIINALYEEFNSKNIDFGDGFPYDLVFKTILNSDNRIKNVSLGNINYTTYAVYQDSTRKLTYTNVDGVNKWLNDEWVEESPLKYGLNPRNPVVGAEITLPATYKEVNISDANDKIYFCSNNKDLSANLNEELFISKLGFLDCYEKQLFTCTSIDNIYGWTLDGEYVDLDDYGISVTGTPVENDELTATVSTTAATISSIDVSLSQTAGTSSLSLSIDDDIIKTKLGFVESKVVKFTYELIDQVPVWELDGEEVDISTYGISINGIVQEDDQFKIKLSYAYQFRNDIYVKNVLAGITQFYIKDEEFDYKLNNRYKELINNIDKIWSNVNIGFSYDSRDNSGNTSYELKQNEALQFFTPHLINGNKYSNATRFEYRINSNETIRANTDYQLGNDEYIIFYWAESEDNVWQYASYGVDTIICPSFDLEPFTGTNIIADVEGYHLLRREAVNGVYQYLNKSSAQYGNMSRECNNAISSSLTSADHKLTGSKNITIKEINQFTIDTESNYGLYWVLNNSVNGRYVLFDEGEDTRVLGNDEMFIYTNPSLTSYTVLGTGTSISRTLTTGIWQVPVVSRNEISLHGLTALQDVFFNVPTNDSLEVTENVFTTLGNGVLITIETPGNNSNICTFNCIPTRQALSTLDIFYFNAETWVNKYERSVSNPGVDYTIDIVYDGTEEKWILNNATYIDLEEYGITITSTDSTSSEEPEEPILVDGDKITIDKFLSYELEFSRETCEIIVPDEETDYRVGEYPLLSDFTFKYQTSDNYEYQYINKVTLINREGFQARSLLGIRMSPTISQVLLPGQSINYTVLNDDTVYTISGDITEEMPYNPTEEDYENNIPATYPQCLFSSFIISNDGSDIINTYTPILNENGTLDNNYLSLYNFIKVLDLPEVISISKPQKIVFSESGNVNFTFTPSDTDRSLTINLPIGEYILGVKNYESNLTACYLALDDVPLTNMHDRLTYDLSETGEYYLYMKIEDTEDHILTMHIEGHTIDCAIQLSNCYKYTYPSNFDSLKIDLVEKWISILDDNHNFKYNYEVPESKLIEDPLKAQEFFNINHFYNSYTIGQLDTIKIK